MDFKGPFQPKWVYEKIIRKGGNIKEYLKLHKNSPSVVSIFFFLPAFLVFLFFFYKFMTDKCQGPLLWFHHCSALPELPTTGGCYRKGHGHAVEGAWAGCCFHLCRVHVLNGPLTWTDPLSALFWHQCAHKGREWNNSSVLDWQLKCPEEKMFVLGPDTATIWLTVRIWAESTE